MLKSEVAKLFEKIVFYYPIFGGDREQARAKIDAWHESLETIPLSQAVENLKRYAADSENKYPPHPGALTKPLDMRTDADRYHEHMHNSGIQTVEQWDLMRKKAVPPTEEQRRKVRESLGR
ncbi:replicative helicase loader/inhibitor [Paenibacillus sinopodophylli]|uniref:replicative helicase loader/inhibitor n=1 Tax=Paenibacillus sinopodophylli TaxID=1837342 RepID=UPI001486B2B5|nr:replicative helicase loader/inhibitor [Paenibacillus sinopodophylli]